MILSKLKTLSISLLVSLTFSKLTICLVSWSPEKGESGWA